MAIETSSHLLKVDVRLVVLDIHPLHGVLVQERIAVPLAESDEKQDPQEEGVDDHFPHDAPHLDLFQALLARSLQQVTVRWLVADLSGPSCSIACQQRSRRCSRSTIANACGKS